MPTSKLGVPSPSIGEGIFTTRDIANILGIAPAKTRRWLNHYWDGRFGKYSWKINNSKAVNFATLIEFYITLQLNEQGIPNKNIFKAHHELSSLFDTKYPFAHQDILDDIRCDGKQLFLKTKFGVISIDGSKQLNLKFIKAFFKNLDFGDDKLPSKLYPMGKRKSIVVDPKRQFGHPVINKTNIYPETIFNLFKAGESTKFIAFTYRLTEKEVKDAIGYCQQAA